jgi:thioredoxin reductase
VEETEVAVVGAGPAGLAAAALLSTHGVAVTLIDERPRPGGQIYRQPPGSEDGSGLPGGRHAAAGRALLAAGAAAPGVRWVGDTLVWALVPPEDAGLPPARPAHWVLALGGANPRRLAARHVLVATGAYDLPVAFPDWTLPGVMTAGGVQGFLKGDRLLPGRRFVLAGGHPLLLVVADQLLAAGGEVAAVAVAQPRPAPRNALAVAARLRGRVAPLRDLAGALRRVRRARVPVVFGHLVARAEGQGRLERVRLTPVDAAWEPRGGGELRYDADTLALGYGFVPATELARQAGCAHSWRPAAGGFVVDHDAWMRTTEDGISVAGEPTGIAGAAQAVEEGRLAAIGILRSLGRLGGAEAERAARPVRRRLERERRLSALVQAWFAPRLEALARLPDQATVVCRCEEVSAGELASALARHPHIGTADALKLLTRVGMGPCQGRFCLPTVTALLAAATGRDPAALGAFYARPPTKPVTVAQLAADPPSSSG